MRLQLHTLATVVGILIHAAVRLRDATHSGIDITRGPGRSSLVRIGIRRIVHVGTYLHQRFYLSAYDGTLLDGSCHPGLKITIFNKLFLCLQATHAHRQEECQRKSPNLHFYSLVIKRCKGSENKAKRQISGAYICLS